MSATTCESLGEYHLETRQLTGVDLLCLVQAFPQRYRALFSSASGVSQSHRYDILFADLQSVPVARLATLDVAQPTMNLPEAMTGLPFVGGYLFFFPYEYAQQVEPSLSLPDAAQWPAQVWQVGAAFIWDKQAQTLSLLLHPDCQLLSAGYWAELDSVLGQRVEAMSIPAQLIEDDEQLFLAAVEQSRAYILAGDVFQVNLSRQWQARIAEQATPVEIFAQLRQTNPAPFSALVCWDNQAIISSSPERLISIQQGRISTRPIGGTRRRDYDAHKDADLKTELSLHPKEQSEHVMLLDLERNDLGRVCVAGSVQVDELMTIESYAHVHHIVSNIVGQLQPNTSALDAIQAVFPGGTITGCPKVRCMEIIAELEGSARGVYTGSVGYVGLDGQMDSNILIRSFYWRPGLLTFNAGAGIVYDSVAQLELEETRHKAKGLLKALDIVEAHD